MDDRGLIPGRCKEILFSVTSLPALIPTQLPIQGYWGLFPRGVKWPGRECDHSSPSIVEDKSCGATRPFPLRLHGVVCN
jgi:hypothetical protein